MAKNILLKTGTVNGQPMTTKELIKLTLDNPPEGGFTFRDFKERARVENAMDKTELVNPGNSLDAFFVLEDHDFSKLSGWVAAMKWARRDPFIVEFCTQFEKQ